MNNLDAPARTVNRTFRSLAGLLVVAAGLAWALPAAAAVVYDNGGADGSRGWWSDFKIGQQLADGFVLGAGNNTFNSASWSGAYWPNNTTTTDNFVIRIFADAGGVPGLNPISSFNVGNAVTRVDSGIDDATWGLDIFNYSASIATTTLTAGTAYWLSVVNSTVGNGNDWLWENSQGSGGLATFRFADGSSWSPFNVELAFQLSFNQTAPIPEPETYAMLLAGLGLLGFAARRRKRKEINAQVPA